MKFDLITFLGTVAAIFTTGSFVPQVIHTIKTKDTKAISLWMYLAFITGVLLWLVYGIFMNAWPIIMANLITFGLCSIVLVIKLKNRLKERNHDSKSK